MRFSLWSGSSRPYGH